MPQTSSPVTAGNDAKASDFNKAVADLTALFGMFNPTSYANDNGGTGWYLNLGGVKILYSISEILTLGPGATNLSTQLPNGFFSTISVAFPFCQYSFGGPVTMFGTDFPVISRVNGQAVTTAPSTNLAWGILVIGT